VAKIYDFLSRKALFELVNHKFKQNDEIVEQHGKYIGVLTKQRTESLRQTIDMTEFKKNQIEQLMWSMRSCGVLRRNGQRSVSFSWGEEQRGRL